LSKKKDLAFGKKRIAKETEYKYNLSKLAQKFLPNEEERVIYKTMEKIYGLHPLSSIDPLMYRRGGIRQSSRKKEFSEWGKKIAKERGIPAYNRAVGIPLGQRALEPYIISGTDVIVDYDDLHHVNNAAIQQLLDDIKRTVILNLDIPHRVLQVRAGKEITPETVNLYLETLQHTVAGGAVAQEHMAEIHPGLTYDAHAKVITGNDDFIDNIDRRFVINIDKEFSPTKAEILKRDIGDTIYIAVRIPTIAVRMADGAVVYRWAAMQSSMAFISSYRLTGESIISDIAYAAKSACLINIGERTWFSRARGQNEPGGIPYGFLADIQQSDNKLPARPYFEVIQEDLDAARNIQREMAKGLGIIASVMTELLNYGFYMSGGLGFSTGVAAGAYCGNVLEDLFDSFAEIQHRSMMKISQVPPRWERVKFMIDMLIQAAMETYEKYPSLMEYHWGGAHRISLVGALGGSGVAMLTGSPLLGVQGQNYAIGMLMKEGWVRTGWAGQEVQDHVGLAYSCSFRMDEGGLAEFRGPNYPLYSYTAGHSAGAIGAVMAAAMGRGRAYAVSPVIKVAFADPDMIFDFKNPRISLAKACLRQFKPAGERDLIIPAH